MKKGKFKYKKGRDGQWYFRVCSANGQTVAQSEGYKSKAGCLRGIRAATKAVYESVNDPVSGIEEE